MGQEIRCGCGRMEDKNDANFCSLLRSVFLPRVALICAGTDCESNRQRERNVRGGTKNEVRIANNPSLEGRVGRCRSC